MSTEAPAPGESYVSRKLLADPEFRKRVEEAARQLREEAARALESEGRYDFTTKDILKMRSIPVR